MKQTTVDIHSLLDDAATALDGAGLHFSSDLEEIRQFVEGPPRIGIVGRQNSGRGDIRALLDEKLDQQSCETFSVGEFTRFTLVDSVVLCTPADSALSHDEIELVEEIVDARRPVIVAVTKTSLLGEGKQREAAKDEVAKYRLEPNLKELGVPYFFEESLSTDFINSCQYRFQDSQTADLHARPALDVLGNIIGEAKDELDDKVQKRDEELARLEQLESQSSNIEARIRDIGESTRLYLREELRTARDNFFEAAKSTTRALVAWVERDGLGQVEDAWQILEEGWEEFCEEVETTMEAVDKRYQENIEELLSRPKSLADELDLELETSSAPPLDWRTKSVERSRRNLMAVDVRGGFEAARSEAKEILEKVQEEEEAADDESLFQKAQAGAKAWAEKQLKKPIETRVDDALMGHLQASFTPRFDSYLETCSDAITEVRKKAREDAIEEFRQSVSAIREQLQDRHSWSSSFSRLLELENEIDAARTGV